MGSSRMCGFVRVQRNLLQAFFHLHLIFNLSFITNQRGRCLDLDGGTDSKGRGQGMGSTGLGQDKVTLWEVAID